MELVRKPAVSGLFYPGTKEKLDKMLDVLMNGQPGKRYPKALIVPHAGYRYSGNTAGKAYSLIKGYDDVPVVVGPSHYFPLSRMVQGGFEKWKTPLGEIKQSKIPGIPEAVNPFLPEHSIEVQVPFLQKAGIKSFVPILTPPALTGKAVDFNSLIIVSSDFSHYHPLKEAERRDEMSHKTIMDVNPDGFLDACGEAGIRMLLRIARENKWKPELVHSSTSYDSTGDASSVVGYRAYAFW